MMKQKVWGTTEQLFGMNNVEIHRIEIKKGGYCSRHLHEYKFNMFYVENGVLQVSVQENDSSIINPTILYKGQSTVVEPKKVHIFLAKEDTIAYEIYWTQMMGEDIVRQTFGGVKTFENDIYTGRFFRKRIKRYQKHEIELANIFYNLFKSIIVYDVGCGIGSYLLGFKKLGCEVFGFDKFFDVAKTYCDKEVVNNIITHDACVNINVKKQSDLTLCIEVAEHIPPLSSEDLVRNLINISGKYIIFTAATPGQRGTGHINCREKEYWINIFSSFGFSRDRNKEIELKSKIDNINDPINLNKNLIVFLKKEIKNG